MRITRKVILVVGDSVYAKELASKKVARPKIRRTIVDDVQARITGFLYPILVLY